jgi:hypothetical protein
MFIKLTRLTAGKDFFTFNRRESFSDLRLLSVRYLEDFVLIFCFSIRVRSVLLVLNHPCPSSSAALPSSGGAHPNIRLDRVCIKVSNASAPT